MARGGYRPGAGRKPKIVKPSMTKVERNVATPKVPDRAPLVPAEARPDFPALDPRAVQLALPELDALLQKHALRKARSEEFNPFKLPKFPKDAIPEASLAMDSNTALTNNLQFGSNAWLAGETIGGLAGEGLLFLGYTYLSELAQRPEYRVISETIADDATRKWIDFDVTGDKMENQRRKLKDPKGEAERAADPDEKEKRIRNAGKLDKVKALRDDQLRLGVKEHFYAQARNDGFFGRSHLYLDIRPSGTEPPPEELAAPIGDGRDSVSVTKVPKGSFHALQTIEPIWTYPLAYNAIDPLRQDWYNPQTWYVMGKQIHGSRIPTFIGHPVPDMLKPAYAFGGLSLSQMAKPYVDIWLTTRESVGTLIHSFSVMVLMTDLSTLMQPGNVNALLARVAIFNMLRDNQGTFVVNKNTEDFKNVSASLSGLHELQAQAQEHMAAVSRIPLVKLTGISPSGLNASSEGEIAVYDDTIAAYQERFFRPNLTKVINFQQLSCFGELDPEITFHFNPLRQPTEAEKGDLQKKQAERDQVYVDMGALSPGEVRRAVIDDPDLPYADLDPDDVPEPPVDEDGGDPFGGGDDDESGGDRPKPDDESGKGANDADVAHFFAHDAWSEADHPRAENGQFGSGGGSSKPPISPKGLKKTGKQMGSNEGGVFETPEGEKLYIKRPASKAHVVNERTAARLYQLAGVNTLTYRDVEGGNHVATELAKLDKKNISEFTPAERKEAAKDFVVHAWLSNWDAAGTGGDNQGIVNGKVTTLDVGGSLRYRAQGGPKGSAFGPKVNELETMRNPSMSPDAARLFGKMTDAELADAAQKVTSIKNDDIREAVGDDQELADTLIARKKDIAERFKLATDDAPWDESKHPRGKGGKFASSAGGGSSGESEGAQMLNLATLLSKPPIAGANYRRQLVKAIKTAEGSQKQKLIENLIASWEKTALNAMKKGDIETAAKIVKKINQLGGSATSIENAKPAAPAPAPSAPAMKKKVEQMIKAPEPLPMPTEAELQKAKKATPTSVSLLAGPTSGPFSSTAKEIVDKFNEKYATKQISDQPGLIQKVHDFKALKAGMAELSSANEKYQAEIAAKAKAEAEQAAKAAADKAAEDAKRAAEKNAKVMSELGISEQQAEGVNALAKMLGSTTGDIVESFKGYEKTASKYGYPITGFQCALIKNYSNGGYSAVNKALRSGAWTPAQHVYVSMVNKALMAMPKFTGICRRGTSLSDEQIAVYKEGHIIQDNGFMSTASQGGGFSGNVRFTVKAIGRRGASIQKLSNHPGESEVLFAARTFFKVNKVTTKGGETHIEMEEWEEH